MLVSFAFLVFLLLVALINLIVPEKHRYIWLFIASMAFYLSIDIKAFFVLCISLMLTYVFGLLLEKNRAAKGRAILAFSLAIQVAMILVFSHSAAGIIKWV